MAIFEAPYLGKIKQSIGGTTFSTWKGKNVAKAKATSVANPNTDKQKNQRAALKFAVGLYRLMSAMISTAFREMAIGQSAYNAFVATNLKNDCITAVNGVAVFDKSKLVIAKGTLDNAVDIEGDSLTAAGVTVAWNPDIAGNMSANDGIVLALVNDAGTVVKSAVVPNIRNAGTYAWIFGGANIANGNYGLYIAFYALESKKVSDSTYIAMVKA